MAKIEQKPKVGVFALFVLEEQEMAALEALASYNIEYFLSTFYEKMGRSYLEPHEGGLRLLFDSVRRDIPPILRRAKEARDVFSGEKIAINPPPQEKQS